MSLIERFLRLFEEGPAGFDPTRISVVDKRGDATGLDKDLGGTPPPPPVNDDDYGDEGDGEGGWPLWKAEKLAAEESAHHSDYLDNWFYVYKKSNGFYSWMHNEGYDPDRSIVSIFRFGERVEEFPEWLNTAIDREQNWSLEPTEEEDEKFFSDLQNFRDQGVEDAREGGYDDERGGWSISAASLFADRVSSEEGQPVAIVKVDEYDERMIERPRYVIRRLSEITPKDAFKVRVIRLGGYRETLDHPSVDEIQQAAQTLIARQQELG